MIKFSASNEKMSNGERFITGYTKRMDGWMFELLIDFHMLFFFFIWNNKKISLLGFPKLKHITVAKNQSVSL